MPKLFRMLINILLYTLTTTALTSLDTYVAANKQCIRLLQAHFLYFFDKPMGGVVAETAETKNYACYITILTLFSPPDPGGGMRSRSGPGYRQSKHNLPVRVI